MTLELLCNPIIKHYEGLITLTTARQHTAKHCASLRTAVCQSLFVLFQPLGTQAEAIHLAEVSYILDKFLQFCNYILSTSEAVFKSVFFCTCIKHTKKLGIFYLHSSSLPCVGYIPVNTLIL